MVGFMALKFCLDAELPDVRAVKEENSFQNLFAYLPNIVQADKQPLCFMYSFITDWVLYVVF